MTESEQNIRHNQKESQQQSKIKVCYNMLEKDWPYPQYCSSISLSDPFLVIQERIKQEHGCIKNLQLYSDSCMRNKIEYKFTNTIQSRIKDLNVIPGEQQSQVLIYYRFDNGYQWPLLSS